ncbi:MAG TPA: hypothetical protein VFN90_08140, partial [Gemmatimonadales bacterium]|nr:hypothetical protein [Gemmatimonadales bacterium]
MTVRLALVLLLPVSLHAQSPSDHALLARLDSALATTAGLPAVTDSPDPVVRQLIRGITGLAEWEQSRHRPTIERALFAFDAAAARRSDWSWPHHLAARAHLRLHAERAPILESAGQRS